MAQGVIKKLVHDRGFGFITADGGDVFFHFTAVAEGEFDNLQEGQTVEFGIEESDRAGKGPRAIDVKPV